MNTRTYEETFDNGPGGWLGWVAGYGVGGGVRKLEIVDGAAKAQPPWGIDFNHAPPGAAYLQLPYVLLTNNERHYQEFSGPNRFVEEGYSTNLTDTKFTVRIRGQMDMKGTEMLLLVQAGVPRDNPKLVANMVLKAQPIAITPDWSEQTLYLAPDPKQWLCMGTRGEGADCPIYGCAPIEDVLRDVNDDIILVLFGLDIVPAVPIQGDIHRLRAGKDYPVDESRLPSGFMLLDTVRIEYPLT
ncbi:MAG: hypothetical protein HYV35_04000 [Lentisphaerae bacterium]|nr:hypothetical protein [Lentisphaerota bacterium]